MFDKIKELQLKLKQAKQLMKEGATFEQALELIYKNK